MGGGVNETTPGTGQKNKKPKFFLINLEALQFEPRLNLHSLHVLRQGTLRLHGEVGVCFGLKGAVFPFLLIFYFSTS